MESCPDCGFELRFMKNEYHGDGLELAYWCYKCKQWKVRCITYKPNSGLVESDKWETA
jgi:hypothetical protein